VQRAGTRVRVNVQLISAATDEHVWASTFDRDVADLFELQTEIAREVARKVTGNVLVTALPRRERPTQSVEAYDLYLQAIAHDADPSLGLQAPDEPLRLLEHAVALDPAFALARAACALRRLGRALGDLVRPLSRRLVRRAAQDRRRARLRAESGGRGIAAGTGARAILGRSRRERGGGPARKRRGTPAEPALCAVPARWRV
jgi:hypothetical protein